MGGLNRDDFPERTKRALALRSNYRCAFPNCGKPTSGPSDESPEHFVNIGVAAHIQAAAPGGPRYDAEQTSLDRLNITNGIWLCQTHSRLIDEDSCAYGVFDLRRMKADHEERVGAEVSGIAGIKSSEDFIAIGLDLVFSGEFVGTQNAEWRVRIDKFLIGDLSALIDFCEQFNRIDPYDRFVLVNAIGDGRQLSAAPVWEKVGAGYYVSLPVLDSFSRINAGDLPLDLALNDVSDIFAVKGEIATVSGLDALPQKIKTCLSTLRGEMSLHPNFGARIVEYFELFRGSPWLPRLIKLEVIRLACLPYGDPVATQNTPLRSVLRVKSVEQLVSSPGDNWIPFRFHLDVKGVGIWQCDLPIFVPLRI